MRKIIHLSLDVEGFLSQAIKSPHLAENMFKGRSSSEAIRILQENLTIGRKMLPFSDQCEGFDYRTGCPGHEVEEG